MSHSTIAVLEQIKALSDEERRELFDALPSLNPSHKITTDGLDLIYEALAWRYEGGPDDAAHVDELRR
ncbi:MAG TPA: hypothetical protein VGO11_16415 [Chthoniobacteraceae bacterium]|jgi:hypothetical protein|nr:hypothetical protein [Chthoniobacteraceae bacterium]